MKNIESTTSACTVIALQTSLLPVTVPSSALRRRTCPETASPSEAEEREFWAARRVFSAADSKVEREDGAGVLYGHEVRKGTPPGNDSQHEGSGR
jgi:hypothetical protein